MGILQTDTIQFESTANNAINYLANTLQFQVGGANVLFINSTAVSINNFSINGNYLSPYPSYRNRIINGDMRVDQRNSGAVQANVASGLYTVDRIIYLTTQASHINSQQ